MTGITDEALVAIKDICNCLSNIMVDNSIWVDVVESVELEGDLFHESGGILISRSLQQKRSNCVDGN